MADLNAFRTLQHLRWADMDANFHMRHSVYLDLGAKGRMDALAVGALTLEAMEELKIGPVLFREEIRYKGEIRLSDEVWLTTAISALSKDYRKFSYRHSFERPDGSLLATLEVDGAWMDMRTRRISVPPQLVIDATNLLPRTTDLTWI